MGETVALELDVDEGGVFVEGLEQDGFDVLAEEVVDEFHVGDGFVVLEGVDEVEEAGVVEAAAGEIELFDSGRGGFVGEEVGELG